jgi:hypothetical protein
MRRILFEVGSSGLRSILKSVYEFILALGIHINVILVVEFSDDELHKIKKKCTKINNLQGPFDIL